MNKLSRLEKEKNHFPEVEKKDMYVPYMGNMS